MDNQNIVNILVVIYMFTAAVINHIQNNINKDLKAKIEDLIEAGKEKDNA